MQAAANDTQQQPVVKMISIAVANLSTPLIDWLVAGLEGVHVSFEDGLVRHAPGSDLQGAPYSPCPDPSVGHVLLEREKLQLRYICPTGGKMDNLWLAQDCLFRTTSSSVDWLTYGRSYAKLSLGYMTGGTMLIAGMRFMVAKRLCGHGKNPTVQVPAKLVARVKKSLSRA